MFTSYGYMLYQEQRSKTCAEIRAEDARRGELAAAISGLWEALTKALGRPSRRWASESPASLPASAAPSAAFGPSPM